MSNRDTCPCCAAVFDSRTALPGSVFVRQDTDPPTVTGRAGPWLCEVVTWRLPWACCTTAH
ncbi:hypothetical protein D3C87_198780 [compost metagenome]